MGDVVNLQPVNLAENHEFVADCCRFQEGILTEANMRLKYRSFTDNVWQDLGANEKLLDAVEEEKIRRIRSGRQKREKAQLLVTKAPDVVSAIMLDPAANPRHRLDASVALDKFAANPMENTPAAMDRFVIQINLGADLNGNPIIEKYDKSIAIDANDGAPNDGERPAPLRPVTIADKPWDDDDVVATPPDKKPIKTTVQEPVKTPEQLAFEAEMNWGGG